VFKELRNELRLRFRLDVAGPLTIRAAKATGIDPTRPDMEVVRDGEGRPVVPGSSLKGVLRSHAERILRSLDPDYACDPFRPDACGRRIRRPPRGGEERYRVLCYACRMFGSVMLRGRVAFADAHPLPDVRLALGERHHVGIDRRTGGSAHTVLFQPETVEAGAFEVRVVLTNFALWQVRLLLAALRDLDAGDIGLGAATTRGYGRVRVPTGGLQALWCDLRPSPPMTLRGYRQEDEAPHGRQVSFAQGPYGWERRWQSLDDLEADLGPDTLLQALARDFPRQVV
jgi:CRISPR-associated protein Csm3